MLKWNAGAFRFYQRKLLEATLATVGGNLESTEGNFRVLEVFSATAGFLLERAGLTSDQIDDIDGEAFAGLCGFCSQMGTMNMEQMSTLNKKKPTQKLAKI